MSTTNEPAAPDRSQASMGSAASAALRVLSRTQAHPALAPKTLFAVAIVEARRTKLGTGGWCLSGRRPTQVLDAPETVSTSKLRHASLAIYRPRVFRASAHTCID